MAKQQDCLTPVTIGGITITENLIDALVSLRDDHGPEGLHFVAETSLHIISLKDSVADIETFDSEFFAILANLYRLLKELSKQKGGKG